MAADDSEAVVRHPAVTAEGLQAQYAALSVSLWRSDLVAFQTRHKLMLMAYSVAGQVQLGRIVAGPHASPEDTRREYGEALARVLATTPSRGRWLNAVQHAFGYVSGQLSPAERSSFMDRCASFHVGRDDLGNLLCCLRAFADRMPGSMYLLGQSLLQAECGLAHPVWLTYRQSEVQGKR